MDRLAGVRTLKIPDIRKVDLVGTSLVARGSDDEVVWEFALPPDTRVDSPPGTPAPRVRLAREPAFVDFGLDGRRVILVQLHSSVTGDNVDSLGQATGGAFKVADLLCLSARGDLLWRFRPAAVLMFAGRTFDGPWRISSWLGPDGSYSGQIWLGINHEIWWPSYLMSIDAAGNETLHYVSAGHIYALASTRHGAMPIILAAGVNNEYAAASLVVLDQQDAAASPQTSSSPYRCDDCPAGRPLRFFVFPRTELNELSSAPYNRAEAITIATSHVEVSIHESSHEGANTRSIYRLSRDLDVESVSMSDFYWELHRRLSKDGKVSHTLQQCDEYNKGKEVRVWTRASGWTTAWAKQESGSASRYGVGAPGFHP